MRLIKLDKDEWEQIPIEMHGQPLLIEVVSNRVIDFGVVDALNLKAFEKDEPFKKIIWFTRLKGPKEFTIQPDPAIGKLWLVLWNGNENKDAYVCYRFSEILS